jgi:hypothetical protein
MSIARRLYPPDFDVNTDTMLGRIDFNVKDIEVCRYIVWALRTKIEEEHGHPATRRIFTEMIRTKRNLAAEKNLTLMVLYISSGLSVEKFATVLAKKNKTFPPGRRYGPTGSTNPTTIAKQIRRQKKLMDADEEYRSVIESQVNFWTGPFKKKLSGIF